jgi:hypothetical protein
MFEDIHDQEGRAAGRVSCVVFIDPAIE